MCVSPPKNPTGCDDRMPPSGRYTVMSQARRLTLMLLYPSVSCCPSVPSNTTSAALEDGTDMVPPGVAPAGTVVVICVGVEAVTTAGVPLKVTVLLPGVVLKPTP